MSEIPEKSGSDIAADTHELIKTWVQRVRRSKGEDFLQSMLWLK